MMQNVMISRAALAVLLGMARSHVEDIESGLEDGSYDAADNENLPEKKGALAAAESVLASQQGGPRVLVTVSGGVADWVCDDGVDVELFDWDNYNADEKGTERPPAHFRDLAEPLGIPERV